MRLLSFLLFMPFLVFAEIDQTLQSDLLEMAKLDQSARKQLADAGWNEAPKALHNKLSTIDHNNTEKLKMLLRHRQWFSMDEVGKEGIGAAFLIIQHSPDTAFQEKMLPVLKTSYLNNEGVSGQEVALLTDRVLIHKGQKQRYGTQANLEDGEIVFMPIVNIDTIDERRAEMNMPPLAFYKKLMEEMYGIKDHPEIDLN